MGQRFLCLFPLASTAMQNLDTEQLCAMNLVGVVGKILQKQFNFTVNQPRRTIQAQ
jgi:hypothetical protein